MALIELKMPALGEGIIEATVLKWLKQAGETVQEEEMVLEIATDKVDSEVPSTATGVIKEVLFGENQVAPRGSHHRADRDRRSSHRHCDSCRPPP